jgi:hypothetical protein
MWTAVFALTAGICFVAVLLIQQAANSPKRETRELVQLLTGVTLTLMVVGVVGCIATQAN